MFAPWIFSVVRNADLNTSLLPPFDATELRKAPPRHKPLRLLDFAFASHLNRRSVLFAELATTTKTVFGRIALDFALPADLVAYLAELDQFIAREIKPIEEADDNIRFFDHRREWARTDFEHGGLPRPEWEALLRRVKNLADEAGHLRFAIPKRYGGKDGSNHWMAVIREHFASKGLGLHNDLQNEHSIVGNLPLVTMLDRYGRDEQKAMIEGSISGKYRVTFGLTEPEHGSDATHMDTRAAQSTRYGVHGCGISG